jgi:hypothetical protein
VQSKDAGLLEIEKGKPVARQGRKAIGPFGNEWQPGRQLIWKEHN